MRKLLLSLISIFILIQSTTAVDDGFCEETTDGFEICGDSNTLMRVTPTGGNKFILDVRKFSKIGPKAFKAVNLLDLHFMHPNPDDCIPQNMNIIPISFDDFWVRNSLKLECIKFEVKPRVFKNFGAAGVLSLRNVQFIGNSSVFFKDFGQLNTLLLDNTNVTTISADTFAGVTNQLRSLILQGIHIIRKRTFINIPNLLALVIRRGQLSDIQEHFFEHLRNLTQLDFKHNNIPALHNARFKSLRNLRELYLDNNRINQIQIKAFFGLRNLRILSLRYNNINYLRPRVFRKLKNLQSLDIAHNKLVRLETNTFEGLDMLAFLRLDYNKISQIDENSFDNAALIKLDLNHNNLTVLEPKTFTSLKGDKLDLRFNNILEIKPHTFEQLNFEQVIFCDLNVTDLSLGAMGFGKVMENGDCSTQGLQHDYAHDIVHLYN